MNAGTYSYTVPDISCEHCKRAIENNVRPLDGVENVIVDIDAKTVTVTGGEAGSIETAIVDAGSTIT